MPAADIVASWQKDLGIDVARLFEGIETLHFLLDSKTGLMRFEPPIEGDAAFYQALREFEWYHPPTKQEFAKAAEWHRTGERVVDIGAGACGFADYVPHDLYCGLETDNEAVQQAVAKGLDARAINMAAYLASGTWRPAEFVTAFQVLEHVSDPHAFMKEVAQLVAPGGRVAIGVPDAESYVADLPDFMLNAPPHHLTWWTEDTLGATLKRAGFRMKAIYRFEVEPWERQLWWMARLARIARPERLGRFGHKLRARKVVSFVGAWMLQILPISNRARGSTLLMIGEKES